MKISNLNKSTKCSKIYHIVYYTIVRARRHHWMKACTWKIILFTHTSWIHAFIGSFEKVKGRSVCMRHFKFLASRRYYFLVQGLIHRRSHLVYHMLKVLNAHAVANSPAHCIFTIIELLYKRKKLGQSNDVNTKMYKNVSIFILQIVM